MPPIKHEDCEECGELLKSRTEPTGLSELPAPGWA